MNARSPSFIRTPYTKFISIASLYSYHPKKALPTIQPRSAGRNQVPSLREKFCCTSTQPRLQSCAYDVWESLASLELCKLCEHVFVAMILFSEINSIPSNTIAYHQILYNSLQYHPLNTDGYYRIPKYHRVPSNEIKCHVISSNTIRDHENPVCCPRCFIHLIWRF